MNNILRRWLRAFRAILHISNMENDLEQMRMFLKEQKVLLEEQKVSMEEQKVLLEEQELRTASTLALLANHQQQIGDQIMELRQLLLQQNHLATNTYTSSNEQRSL